MNFIYVFRWKMKNPKLQLLIQMAGLLEWVLHNLKIGGSILPVSVWNVKFWQKTFKLKFAIRQYRCLFQEFCQKTFKSNFAQRCLSWKWPPTIGLYFVSFTKKYGFKTEITFLPGNNYPDSHHSQGGMKFATQLSPLLN